MKSRLSVALLAIVALAAGHSVTQAQYDYAVQGVAPDDMLNIRERIEGADDVSSARIVGSIPANAVDVAGTGLTVLVGESRWHEIVYRGVKGWVNGRYLKVIRGGNNTSPPIFACSGTEPFWSIELGADEATFTNPSAAKGKNVSRFDVTQRRPARGRTNIEVLSLQGRGSKPLQSMAVLIRNDTCSDDMSDFTYPYEVILSVGDDAGSDADTGTGTGDVWHGCCSLVR